jgi:exopolysaccharide biosynthesis polyprenyl glycosylphosphotransferase
MMADFPLLSMLDEPLPGRRRYLKRAGDLFVATVALGVAAPVMLAAALAVRLSSPGPVLFRQERVGMDGRCFRMLKFRTMAVGADSRAHERYVAGLIAGGSRADGRLNKLVDDPRVTPVGRVLRRFSIDELPQLLNVVKGDMSLVGPRPALPYEVARYEDWHRRRLEMRPGVTGLWQVSGRSRLTFEEMIHLDVHYIENWTPLCDLKIVLRTVPAVLRREAA